MKKYSLLLVLLSLWLPARADYNAYGLHALIFKADLIVYGEIVNVGEADFTLKVEGAIEGEFDKLKVKKFKNWTCAQRWTEYEVGQRALFFLGISGGKAYVLGAGNEGELPFATDSVYLNYIGGKFPKRFTWDPNSGEYLRTKEFFLFKPHDIYGGKYRGYAVKLDDFIATIKLVKRCFRATFYERSVRIKKVVTSCDESYLERFKSASLLNEWIYGNLIDELED